MYCEYAGRPCTVVDCRSCDDVELEDVVWVCSQCLRPEDQVAALYTDGVCIRCIRMRICLSAVKNGVG